MCYARLLSNLKLCNASSAAFIIGVTLQQVFFGQLPSPCCKITDNNFK